jgi:hypothetical protein
LRILPSAPTCLRAFQGQRAMTPPVQIGEQRLAPLLVRGQLVAALLASPNWLPVLTDFLALWADARQVDFTHYARTLLNEICGLSQTAHEGAHLLWEAMLAEDKSRSEMAEIVEDLRVVVRAALQLVDLVAGRGE